MKHNNWEHYYHGDEDNREFDEGAYTFYDFDETEIEQMERDRLAAFDDDSASKDKAQNFLKDKMSRFKS